MHNQRGALCGRRCSGARVGATNSGHAGLRWQWIIAVAVVVVVVVYVRQNQ